MSKRSKTPDLADFEVGFLPAAGDAVPRPWAVIRASRLRVRGPSVVLEDDSGEPVFAAPALRTVIRPVPPPRDRKLADPGLTAGETPEAATRRREMRRQSQNATKATL